MVRAGARPRLRRAVRLLHRQRRAVHARDGSVSARAQAPQRGEEEHGEVCKLCIRNCALRPVPDAGNVLCHERLSAISVITSLPVLSFAFVLGAAMAAVYVKQFAIVDRDRAVVDRFERMVGPSASQTTLSTIPKLDYSVFCLDVVSTMTTTVRSAPTKCSIQCNNHFSATPSASVSSTIGASAHCMTVFPLANDNSCSPESIQSRRCSISGQQMEKFLGGWMLVDNSFECGLSTSTIVNTLGKPGQILKRYITDFTHAFSIGAVMFFSAAEIHGVQRVFGNYISQCPVQFWPFSAPVVVKAPWSPFMLFEIKGDAIHLRPLPWPFLYDSAAPVQRSKKHIPEFLWMSFDPGLVHLETSQSMNIMLGNSTQLCCGSWSPFYLGWFAVQGSRSMVQIIVWPILMHEILVANMEHFLVSPQNKGKLLNPDGVFHKPMNYSKQWQLIFIQLSGKAKEHFLENEWYRDCAAQLGPIMNNCLGYDFDSRVCNSSKGSDGLHISHH